MYVFGVNSAVTKHSDYFVRKETSGRMARRCDDTVDKKRLNPCVLKTHLFGESWTTQKLPKNPESAFSDALLMSRFQNSARFFETRASINSLINTDQFGAKDSQKLFSSPGGGALSGDVQMCSKRALISQHSFREEKGCAACST